MDIQLKRGMLDICVLACLVGADSYGYKLIKDLSGVVEMSESTLYPILRRLESADCLTTYSREFEGRLRKYYSLTQDGRKRIVAFLEDWQGLNAIYSFVKLSLRQEV